MLLQLRSYLVRSAARSLHISIDHALAVSYRRNAYDKKAAFVAHITLVKGVPFYGYHVGYRFFFKIYLLNPIYTTRLADLLLQGAVMKRPIQPYESHIQYIPQWMCDYSLFGCAFMKCGKVAFRSPIPEYLDLPDLFHRWHDRSIPSGWISDESVLPKQSHCPLEADVCAQDILNRLEINERPIHHDFGELLKPAVLSEKLVPSLAGLWQDEKRRRKKRLGLVDPDSSPFSNEDLVSFTSDPRKSSQGDWIHGDEFQLLVQQIAAEERHQDSDQDATLDGLLRDNMYEKDVKTALESVEDFFPGPDGFTNLQLRYNSESDPAEERAQDYVDEDAVRLVESNAEPNSSDEDGMTDIFSEDEDEVDLVKFVTNMQQDENSDENYQTHEHKPFGSRYDELDSERNGTSRSEELGSVPGLETHGIQLDVPTQKKIQSGYMPATRLEQNKILDKTTQSCIHSSHPQPWEANSEHDITMKDYNNMPSRRAEQSSPQEQPFSSQSTIRPKGMSQTGTLNFPVVKDPKDPMTILRFSQEGSNSKVLSDMVAKQNGDPGKVEGMMQPYSSTETEFDGSSDIIASEFADIMLEAFNIPSNIRLGCLRQPCPSPREVSSTINAYGYPSVIYQDAHYSRDDDVPDRPRDYAGREFRLGGTSIHYLPDFDPSGRFTVMLGEQDIGSKDRRDWNEADHQLRVASTARVWEFAAVPPSRSEVITWFENQQRKTLTTPTKTKERHEDKESRVQALSQIEGPTQKNDHGSKYSQNGESTSVEHQAQYMSTMSLEVHVNTRGVLSPNPEEDEIASFFWCISAEDEFLEDNDVPSGTQIGIVFQGEGKRPELKVSKALRMDWEHEPTELDLINRLVDIVRLHDPDIITGYEVHNSSWGYVIERAKKKYDFDLCDELSRVKSQAHGRFGKEADKWGFNQTSSIRITGRHMINIWRAMRSEMNLLQYTMENVVFHLLHRRIPHYSFRDLTAWYQSDRPRDFMKVVNYFVSRVQMNIEILDANELIPRISEQARLLGIDFYSVFSRGSQFKVESLMFRIAKPENFILVSPSRKQVGQQNALECLPLVMEPQSDF